MLCCFEFISYGEFISRDSILILVRNIFFRNNINGEICRLECCCTVVYVLGHNVCFSAVCDVYDALVAFVGHT